MIISNESKQTVSELIRDAFDNVDMELDFIYNKADSLIKAAKEFGLNGLAEQMENDI